MARFAAVIANTWAIVFRSLKFQGFNLVISQIAVVFPIVIQARRFFSQADHARRCHSDRDAFGQVEGALSFFRLAYDDFASYRASLNRLTGLLDANEEARALPAPTSRSGRLDWAFATLTYASRMAASILTDLDLDIAGGESLVVNGPSGSGKTTLLRSLAGLWPYVEGTISRSPISSISMFCAQQPYLPLGSLRTALAYPAPSRDLGDDVAVGTLRSIQLGQLADRLDL